MNKTAKLALFAFAVTVSGFAYDVDTTPTTVFTDVIAIDESDVIAMDITSEEDMLTSLIAEDDFDVMGEEESQMSGILMNGFIIDDFDPDAQIDMALIDSDDELWAAAGDVASDFQVVSLCDVTADELNQMVDGLLSDVVIEFPAQAQLPLRFFLRGDLVNFAEEPRDLGFVLVAQTFYLRSIQGKLFLSADLTNWTPFLEFIRGNLSIGFNKQGDSVFFGLEIELNRNA